MWGRTVWELPRPRGRRGLRGRARQGLRTAPPSCELWQSPSLMLAWTLKPFDALPSHELYDALALRQRVFVVEQRCVYLDCDGLDTVASISPDVRKTAS
jgi:hypothetical protein